MPSTTLRHACLSCRRRKLRCDKNYPCDNCVSRSLQCERQSLSQAGRAAAKRPVDEATSSALPGILTRLSQIEKDVSFIKDQKQLPTFIRGGLDGAGDRLRSLDSRARLLSRASPVEDHVVAEAQDTIVNHLAHENFMDHAFMHNLSISVSEHGQGLGEVETGRIQLPPKEEAIRSFHVYFEHIGPFQQIIYRPHTHAMVENVYHQVSTATSTTAPRGLALILSIVALATILEPLEGHLDTVLPILKQRLKTSAGYIRCAMDCLEQHRRRMNHAIESVQAMLVLTFLINHIEMFSPRYRTMFAEAVAVSHRLGLHVIDSVARKRPQGEADALDREMGRRVWWYLTATDWMVSMAEGGPSNAVYLVNPKSCASNTPKNINDDDLGNPDARVRPSSEPTAMSYNLHRLKVAEVARSISDTIPHDPSLATCEMILPLDARLESLIQDLPMFFRLEVASSPETVRLERIQPHLQIQRLLINLMINLVRCRLHFPYISGSSSPSLHAFSRQAGLRAAFQLLETHRGLIRPESSRAPDFMKIQGLAFHMLVGALVLATDICCNQPQAEDRQRQLSELGSALRKLQGIKQHSQSAAAFLDCLSEILVKHGLSLPLEDAVPFAFENDGGSAPDPEVMADNLPPTLEADLSMDFGDLWEAFVENPSGTDPFDLFWEPSPKP